MYRKRKQRKSTLRHLENVTTGNDVAEEENPPPRSRRASVSSIYDDIDVYELVGRHEANGEASAYTGLTSDPYAYDELYGIQRIAIRVDPPSQEELAEPQEGPSARAWTSLPADLNQVNAQETSCSEEQTEYVDMLPNRLEVYANVKEETGTNLGLSKSMNNVVGCNTNKNKI